jgi:ADP-ribose diphosphatase
MSSAIQEEGAMPKKKPELLQTTLIAQSRLFDIEGMHLRFSNGKECHFERIRGEPHGAVMVVPFLDPNTILLIREYAAGIDDYVLGFPKGSVELNETPFETAHRELREEVGYAARELALLTRYSASPSYWQSMMTVYVARDLYPATLVGDEPEAIEVVPWSLDSIDELLAHDQFHEARSVASLCLLARRRHEQ